MITDSIVHLGPQTLDTPTVQGLIDQFGVSNLRRYANNQIGGLHEAYAFRTHIITTPATYDADGNIIDPPVYLAGYSAWLRTMEPGDAILLWQLPYNICRLQLDYDTGRVVNRRNTLAVLNTLALDPIIAGSNYHFGSLEDLL